VRSHEVAKILLEAPDAPLVIKSSRTINDVHWFGGTSVFREATSIIWTNCGQFIDANGDEGSDYNSARECVEIK
jgi:hypothetical protein